MLSAIPPYTNLAPSTKSIGYKHPMVRFGRSLFQECLDINPIQSGRPEKDSLSVFSDRGKSVIEILNCLNLPSHIEFSIADPSETYFLGEYNSRHMGDYKVYKGSAGKLTIEVIDRIDSFSRKIIIYQKGRWGHKGKIMIELDKENATASAPIVSVKDGKSDFSNLVYEAKLTENENSVVTQAIVAYQELKPLLQVVLNSEPDPLKQV